MRQLTLILDNIRSAHNVGAIARSAAAFGVTQLICLGITPYPPLEPDSRLPHLAAKAGRQIAKTALGAERSCQFQHFSTFEAARSTLKDMPVYALEQTPDARNIADFQPVLPAALVVGNEVSGVNPAIMAQCHAIVEITHTATKESLNVAAATSIALFAFTQSS